MEKRKMNPKSLENLKNGKEHQFKKGEKKPKEEVIRREQTKKANREFKQLLQIELALPDEETGEQNDIAITKSMIKQAKSGNVKAFETIRDTIGQKPVERQEIVSNSLEIKVIND